MKSKRNRYAGIYDRITHEHVCMDCYTDEDAYRLAIYLPIGGVVNDPCICVRCEEPLEVTVFEGEEANTIQPLAA